MAEAERPVPVQAQPGALTTRCAVPSAQTLRKRMSVLYTLRARTRPSRSVTVMHTLTPPCSAGGSRLWTIARSCYECSSVTLPCTRSLEQDAHCLEMVTEAGL